MRSKTMRRLLCLTLTFIFCVSSLGIANASDTIGEPIQFKSKMMESVSSQLKEATDLTKTEANRAVLAALLTLEFQVQEPDVKLDLLSPIYIGKYGTVASVSFNTNKGYVIVMYQMKPLTTYYSFSNSKDSKMAKTALEMSSDEVWEVSYELYLEKLTALVKQIE